MRWNRRFQRLARWTTCGLLIRFTIVRRTLSVSGGHIERDLVVALWSFGLLGKLGIEGGDGRRVLIPGVELHLVRLPLIILAIIHSQIESLFLLSSQDSLLLEE
jgi:hypothetical protein